MTNAIILKTKDIKEILAEKFNVDVKKIVCTQYSYVVEIDEEGDTNEIAK